MNIKAIQRRLNQLGYDAGPVDGWRGRKTIAAIKQFQRDQELIVDGIAGPQTFHALSAAIARPRTRKEPNKQAMQSLKVVPSEIGIVPREPEIILPDSMLITRRFIREIIIHCAATPEGRNFTVADVTAWHKQRGWNRCGYHFVILLDGTIQVGCAIGQPGIHCRGKNTGTIGISYIGGLTRDGKLAKDTRTGPQVASINALLKRLVVLHPVEVISGHNQYAAKACPSFKVPPDRFGNIVGFADGRRL